MSQDGTSSVLIIGAGPTGMTAALELARFGIEVRIIEKTPEPATTSRAVGVQARTLELLEQRGLAAQLVEAGNPGYAGSYYGGGKRVFRQDFSHIDSRYNYLLSCARCSHRRKRLPGPSGGRIRSFVRCSTISLRSWSAIHSCKRRARSA